MKKNMVFLVWLSASLFAGTIQAVDCSNLGLWTNEQIYTGGNQVQHNSNAYTANYWTQNNDPETHSTNPWDHWRLEGVCDDGAPVPNRPPVSDANGPYSGEPGESINFSSANSTDPDGVISSFTWDFGDGNVSDNANPSHAYENQGSYTATLTVVDDDGVSASNSATVNIVSDGGSGSGNCGDLPPYVVGDIYIAGERVFNLRSSDNQHVEYVCVIGGWCSSNSSFHYEPGNGIAWDEAWDEVAICDGDSPQAPVANANGVYSGLLGNVINFSSSGSTDPDGSIVNYLWSFGDGASSSESNPSHLYASVGSYNVALTVTDNDGRSATDTTIASISDSSGGNPDSLPDRIINGYWHNFDNGSGVIRLRDVSADYNVINVSFAEPTTTTSGQMEFDLDPLFDETEFRSDIRTVQARGQKVLISIGGAEGQVRLITSAARDNFVSSMINIVEDYGFDGIDIDFEGQSLSLDFGDDDFRDPTTPVIVNTISAIRSITDHFGSDFMLTMTPETFFVQLGYSFYGGISAGADRRAGAYLPVIHALRDRLTFLQVQNYNSGPITGLDNQFHTMGTADFHVAMIDMLLKGFPITGDTTKFFPPLRQDQVLLGLPAYVQAGGGFTSASEVHKALDCLIKAANCEGIYSPGTTYPDMRGLMTWSINWDRFGGFNFSVPHRAYLNALP